MRQYSQIDRKESELVDHAITLDLSIRLHSPTSMKGGEVVKFQ